MSAGFDAWADPATPTQPGQPYAGPPPTAPPFPGPYPSYGYAQPPYGYRQPYAAWPPGPPSPWAARGPQRPGQALAASVLAFVQTGLVVVASLYLWFFSSVADMAFGGVDASTTVRGLASEGSTLALVQLLSAGLLVAGGVTALSRRAPGARLLLLGAHAVQVALAAYWTARLLALLADIPGDDTASPVLIVTLFFATAPGVGLGLLLTGPGRRWFDGTPQA